MKYDIVLAGVGGQGVLSIANAIALAAMKAGLNVRQSEVHGMAQRGGAVSAHLRLSDKTIESDLIGTHCAQMILSMEPMESLRYLNYLAEGGVLVTSSDPVKNIGDYPDLDALLSQIKSIPGSRIIDAKTLSREAGNQKAINVIMVGAASRALPLAREQLEAAIAQLFAAKGQAVVDSNIKAFALGASA